MKETIMKNKYIFFVLLFLVAMTLSLSPGSTKAKYSETVDVCTIHLDFSEEAETENSDEAQVITPRETSQEPTPETEPVADAAADLQTELISEAVTEPQTEPATNPQDENTDW